MRLSVAWGFEDFSNDLEGERIPWPYLDSKDDGNPKTLMDGLVTTCTGNLIDPVSLALSPDLPWRIVENRGKRAAIPSDRLATREEIVLWWKAVKAAQHRKKQGGGKHFDLSPLRLLPEDVVRFVHKRLHDVDRQLESLFPAWDTWPADAQLALISWAWAAGAGAKYPKMIEALRHGDFLAAAEEVKVWDIAADGTKREPGTLKTRNERMRVLLRNAAHVAAGGMDPEPLRWPVVVVEPTTIVGEPSGNV